jgi:hypothetical protein
MQAGIGVSNLLDSAASRSTGPSGQAVSIKPVGMAVSRILLQPGMSLLKSPELDSSEEPCETALEQSGWPN